MNPTELTSKIHFIRNEWVMIDFELAHLYAVSTKSLNQAVKRNISRFPDDFMFQLSILEWEQIIENQPETMRSQIVTASIKKRNITALPKAFTEQGVAMLSSILRSEKAIKMNIAIIRAFIEIRRSVHSIELLRSVIENIQNKLLEHDTQLDDLYNALEQLIEEKTRQTTWQEREKIGFRQSH